ncbi:MAG: CAP domain-containing protein [bacterium]
MSPGRWRIPHLPTRSTFRLLVALTLLELAGPAPPSAQGQHILELPPVGSPHWVRSDLESLLLGLINTERRTAGLPVVASHPGLRHAARAHALDMVTHGYLSHQSRDGRSPRQRTPQTTVGVRVLGENVAYATDVRAAHLAFMSSIVHRGVILSRSARLVGVAVVETAGFAVIVVQDFGR